MSLKHSARENTLRLSFSCASFEMIDEGIARLGELVRSETVRPAA